jgi:hypothetical protein
MTNDDLYLVLYSLFILSRENSPIDAGTLGRLAGLSPTQVGRALIQLERAGLADASRIRLTMTGLAVALSPKAKAGARRLAVALAHPLAHARPLPLAARPDHSAIDG